MIEEIAFQHIGMTSYGFSILGGLAASVNSTSGALIRRGPYFAYSALVTLGIAVLEVMWLQVYSAASAGYLSLLVLVRLAGASLLGYFVGSIAIERSRDAYGHGHQAFLAFIPLGNFVLILTPSKKSAPVTSKPAMLDGGRGVALGVLSVLASVSMFAYVRSQSNRPAMQSAVIEQMIKHNGLNYALQKLLIGVRTPTEFDDGMILSHIAVEGSELRRTFVVEAERFGFGVDQERVIRVICSHEPFTPLLQAGASIKDEYLTQYGVQIGAVTVTEKDCKS